MGFTCFSIIVKICGTVAKPKKKRGKLVYLKPVAEPKVFP